MPSLRLSLTMAAATLCLAGCGSSLAPKLEQKDFGSLSLQLKKDMSEVEVAKAVGVSPDKTDNATCTDHDGNPWQCKTWTYYGGRPKNSLRVVFYQADDKAWRAAAWQVY